eukprot:COSAG06_NODE_12202_length_1410_cov_1.606407_1_plen_102_part_10
MKTETDRRGFGGKVSATRVCVPWRFALFSRVLRMSTRAGSKEDADGDAEDHERLMGALLGAATAKDLGKAGQHFRSASLQLWKRAGGQAVSVGLRERHSGC